MRSVLSEDSLPVVGLYGVQFMWIFNTHVVNYIYFQFWMDVVQKLFQKYDTLPTSSIRTLFPDPNARFTETFPWHEASNRHKETCQWKMSGLHWKQRNKRQYICAMAVFDVNTSIRKGHSEFFGNKIVKGVRWRKCVRSQWREKFNSQ
jgi:hypothetical protein